MSTVKNKWVVKDNFKRWWQVKVLLFFSAKPFFSIVLLTVVDSVLWRHAEPQDWRKTVSSKPSKVENKASWPFWWGICSWSCTALIHWCVKLWFFAEWRVENWADKGQRNYRHEVHGEMAKMLLISYWHWRLFSLPNLPSMKCAHVMAIVLGHLGGLVGSSSLGFSVFVNPFKDLYFSVWSETQLGNMYLFWMGPGCDRRFPIRIAPIMTLLLAKVCSDCLVNYNVGLFELYNWQIYISQGLVHFESLWHHKRVRSIYTMIMIWKVIAANLARTLSWI